VPGVVFLAGDPDWLGPALRRASDGREYAFLTRESSAESLASALSEAQALIARPGDVLAVQPACPNLRFVQFTSCDYDQAVLTELQSQKLRVAGLGAALAGEVAAVAVGLMLALNGSAQPESAQGESARPAGAHQAGVKRPDAPRGPVRPADDRWKPLLQQMSGRTVGIIGLGRVGAAVARLLQPSGAHMLYSDIRTAPQMLSRELRELGIRRSTQDRLVVEAEFVTVHVPVTDQSRNLLGRREFGLFRSESALINTSAPELVDRQTVLTALKQGRMRGYGTTDLDPGFAGLPNLVMADPKVLRTADIAARVAVWIVENVDRALAGEEPRGSVETIGYPRSGDPAFWSSRMIPREAMQ
jgi:phosphoglycerate dehydrogenase-like enzyme